MVPFTWLPRPARRVHVVHADGGHDLGLRAPVARRAARSAALRADARLAHAAPERASFWSRSSRSDSSTCRWLCSARRRDRRAARPGTRGRRRSSRPAFSSSRTPSSWCRGWRGRSAGARCPVRPGDGGRAAAAGRILRLERQPHPAARVVSHRHRDDGTEPAPPENISFASMWAKWIQPGPAAVEPRAGLGGRGRRRGSGRHGHAAARVAKPNYLEAAYFLLLVPLLSPQGWDYVLLIGLPAYMLLVDRWRELSPAWRAVAADRHLPHELHHLRPAAPTPVYSS